MAGKLTTDEIKWILSLDAKGVQSELVNISSKAQELTQNNKELGAELKVVEKDMDRLQSQMAKLAASGDTSSEKYERLRRAFLATADDANDLRFRIDENQRSIDNYNKKADQLVQTLKVQDMTMDQLKKRALELEKQLYHTSQSTDPAAYAELEKRLNEVRGRMGELKNGTNETDNIFAQFTSTVNKYWATIVAGYKTAEGVFSTWKDLMLSNRATGTEFEATMNGVNSALDYAKVAFANMDFTNFIEGMIGAYEAGRDVSKMLDELFDRQNSFDLTTIPIRAEIEELKTRARDVNLSEEERYKITVQIIDKTKELSVLQKDILQQEVDANEKLLDAHISMTTAEKDYVIFNYNKNLESLRFAKELIEKEKERDSIKRNALVFSDKFEKAQHLLNAEALDKEIEQMKQSAMFSEVAYTGMQKYLIGSKELINAYVNPLKKFLNVEAQVNRELRMTKRLQDTLVKSGNLVTESMKQFNDMTNDELKEWISKSETASTEFSKNIASAFSSIRSNWNKTEGFLNKIKGAISGFTGMQKSEESYNEYTDQDNIDAALAVYNRRFGKNSAKARESAEQKELKRQKKELTDLNEDLEIAHKEKLAKINQDYLSGEIKTQADYNRKLFAQEQSYYLLREESLKAFIQRATKEEVKRDASKQLATVQEKMLSQQVKYQNELEKIILNADPVEKEKQAYAERLSALGIYGESAGSLQLEIAAAETEQEKKQWQQKYDAFILLEKQFHDNMDKIKKAGKAKEKADAEAAFQESFKQRKEEMQQELNALTSTAASLSGNAAFEAEMAVHVQKLRMIQEEVDARREAGAETAKLVADIGKIETQLTTTLQKENARRITTYNQYATTLGTATGEVLSGQKTAFEAFGSSMIDILFDILTQTINTKIVEATAVAVAEQAKAAAIAAALPDSVLTFGASSIARTAAISAIIMGALQVAKSALKGMIGKKSRSSSSSSSTGTTPSSGAITVKQKGFADGGQHTIGGYTGDGAKYDIKGFFPDGEPYHAGEYMIPKEEMKVPWIQDMVRQIDSSRLKRTNKNPLPSGFAEGGGHDVDPADMFAFGMDSGMMSRFIEVMEKLEKKEFKGYWGVTEYQSMLDDLHKEDNRFKKK